MRSYLDFEKPVAELEAKVEEMRALQADGDAIAIGEEINRIEVKAGQALKELYASLTPWQKTQVARHPQRHDYRSRISKHLGTECGPRRRRRGCTHARDHARHR